MKKRDLKRNINFWSITTIIFVLLIVLPSIFIMAKLFESPEDIWFHIKQYTLTSYVINTLIIIFFTGLFSAFIGVSLAWFITMYEFPLRRLFQWALVLPLAIPPFIAAYTYSGLLNYTGVIQVFLREQMNINVNQKFFNIMNIPGAIFIFTIVLYPYVYMICKSFLQKQSSTLIETSRVLGRNQFETFLYVGLPILRTALVASTTLVILEVLNDYGVVSYFNIHVFSTAIFTAWFQYGSVNSAVRLSAILMVIVISLLVIEKLARGRRVYSYTNTKIKPIQRIQLYRFKKNGVVLYCFLILGIGFIIPVMQLLAWSLITFNKVFNIQFVYMTINTVSLAVISTAIIVFVSLVIANFTRNYKNNFTKIISRITTLGYSIPGAVIAIAVITFFIATDHLLYPLYLFFNPESKRLVLTTSIYMLMFAFIIRFMAIGYNSIESGFDKIGKTFSQASHCLGKNTFQTFIKVDIPMLKPAIYSASILVFVDIIKELPLTLILRPFNYNTLATKTYEYISDEMVHETSIPSLFIIAISVIAILFLHMIMKKGKPKHVR